ncbi:MAG: EamA family transporter, partial [Clostridia bacterium]|nr:EamA family transporter [Clostridia bacterium]
MENIWIILALSYGVLKGVRECMKKFALKKSSLMEILFFYMLVGFVFTLPDLKTAFALDPFYIFWIFVKSVFVCTGFILSFMAIKRMPISLYSVVILSQMVFTTIFGVAFLKEPFGISNLAGLLLVILGLVLVNLKKDGDKGGKFKFVPLVLAVLYTFFNAISATMDKVLMQHMNSGQLQFWFMFFSVVIYGLIIVVKKEKISIKTLKTNFWIPVMGFLLMIGDRLLFEANGHPNSKVTVITLLIQCSVIVSILIGRLV